MKKVKRTPSNFSTGWRIREAMGIHKKSSVQKQKRGKRGSREKKSGERLASR